MMTALANHLWQSTLFAGVLALLAVALRRNSARVRYGLWLTASIKFLVPFSLLVSLGQQLQEVPAARQIATQIALPSISNTMGHITQPFPQEISKVTPLPTPQPSNSDWLRKVLGSVWFAGFVAIVLVRLRAWSGIRRVVRASAPLHLDIPIPVRTSLVLVEPGIFGFFRPLLLLPSGILQRLTTPQLEAVLAHELCHVKRRDNLTAIVQMLDEAIFWFHPLVWWIGAKLVEERERACDEDVLRLGNEPLVYAEGILNVCKDYQESPVVCVSGVTGSDLKKRIENIIMNREVHKLSFTKAMLMVVVGAIVVTVPVAAGAVRSSAVAAVIREVVSPMTAPPAPVVRSGQLQTPRTTPPAPGEAETRLAQSVQVTTAAVSPREAFEEAPIAQDAELRFEVASVRASGPVPRGTPLRGGPPQGGPGTSSPERLTYERTLFRQLLMNAYGVQRDQIKGPDWATADAVAGGALYDIAAIIPKGATKEQVAIMLQNLLKDRFKLALHHEKVEFSGFGLVVAKSGPKLMKSAGPLRESEQATIGNRGTVSLHVEKDGFPNLFPGRNMGGTFKDGTVRMRFRDYGLSGLAQQFSFALGARIIDKTGLTEKYDFTLEFTLPQSGNMVGSFATLPLSPNQDAPLNSGGPNPGQSDSVPIVSSAMEKQLGLKLEALKVAVDTLVIDHVEETPTDN
jgi:bla regulator protein BlaR1